MVRKSSGASSATRARRSSVRRIRQGAPGVSCSRARSFANSSDGWRHLLDWLITQKIRRVHACLESTGRYSLGIARALYEAGHVVSIINPAQVRDFARTKLGRNKTDGVDASHIREYCELFKPQPWTPPSE